MRALSILHITDLHYASPRTNYQDDNKAEVPDALRASAFRNLSAILRYGFANKVHVVTIGGDITTKGDPTGFEAFQKEIAELLLGLAPKPNAICVTAGNHDVLWKLDPQEKDYFDKKFGAYRSLVQGLGATSCLVPTGNIPESPEKSISFDGTVQGPLYLDQERKLLVLCINSSMRCGEVNLKMKGALSSPIRKAIETLTVCAKHTSTTDEQRVILDGVQNELRQTQAEVDERSLFDIPHVTHLQLSSMSALLMETKAGLKDWESYLKIALLHHHVVPFDYQMPEYKPFEVMADAASTLEALASFGFHLVLTGHKHQPYTQQVRFDEHELLVVGGMTVGGYPVPGFGQGLRHLSVQRNDGDILIQVADVPCNRTGNIRGLVDQALKDAPRYTLQRIFTRRRLFPAKIEKAVEGQLYERPFYKTDVKFDVEVTAIDAVGLCFDTKFSYTVVNRTSETEFWHVEYKYDRKTGSIQEACVNGKNYDPEQREFRIDRGLSVPVKLAGNERADISTSEGDLARGGFDSVHQLQSGN